MQQIISTVVAVVAGVAVSLLIYICLNFVISKAPGRLKFRLLPVVFLLPAVALLLIFIIIPAAFTAFQSLFTYDMYGVSSFGGLANYVSLFTSPAFIDTLVNNLLWLIIVPTGTLVLGLAIAFFADKLGPGRESAIKTVIFLPRSISFIVAATIWSFVYAYSPASRPQIGLLNALWVGLTGQDPVPWLQVDFSRLNSLLIMAVVIWLNTGYAMVLLSAAMKSVPEETIEAARIDGAGGGQVFFQVIVPQIRTTIILVFVTVLITVMKIFDIVFAMTNGQFNTNVIGLEFYNQLFLFNNPGKAAAVVVILMFAIIPIMVYQIRTYREQEALR